MTIPSEPGTQAEDGKVDGSLFPLCPHDNSLWSLKLNEIELKSGKSFGSMNMDEFLANLWNSAEDTSQVPQPQQSNHHDDHRSNNDPTTNQPFDDDTSRQQCSLISIPPPLCKKTVDEVWSEIQRDQQCSTSHLKPTESTNVAIPHERQQSLGEITLEDFLVQAGVVSTTTAAAATASSSSSTGLIQQLKLETPSSFGSFHGPNYNDFSNASDCFASYRAMNPSRVYVGEASSSEFMKLDFEKEKIGGPTEVLVERRQRRMIKNRESAARSRARKQAYTMELELELNYLKEDNSRLKQIVQEIEQKAREKIMRMKKEAVRQNKKTDKLRSIRRTTSMSW